MANVQHPDSWVLTSNAIKANKRAILPANAKGHNHTPTSKFALSMNKCVYVEM